MSWIKSFLLHPFLNWINLLFLFLAAPAAWFFSLLLTDGVAWPLAAAVTATEAIYLVVRNLLDRGDNPFLQIRRLPPKTRQRFFQLWMTARRAREELASDKSLHAGMLAGPNQIRRLLRSYLKLTLAGHKIDMLIASRRDNYDLEIQLAKNNLATASPAQQPVLQSNLEMLEKRRKNHQDLLSRRQTIGHRLQATENAIELLAEKAVAIVDPTEVKSQVDTLLTNIEDSETFAAELDRLIKPVDLSS